MPTSEQYVDNQNDLGEVIQHLATAERIGFDTEFVGENTYHPELCLIQVATPDRLILIDPLQVGTLDSFWRLLTSGQVEVVTHAGREEIRLCKIASGHPPGRLFDVQIAAGMIGLAYPIGHASLVSQLLGVSLAKTETLTDWRSRPLTPQQIRYAFDDVRHLLQLHRILQNRLEKMDRRAWAEEEFGRLIHTATDEEPARERWRRLRGASQLNPQQMAMVRAVYTWRQERALQLNRPARSLCRDDLLVELVRRDPRHPHDLAPIRGLGLSRKEVDGLLAAMEAGRRTPPSAWPLPVEREHDPPQTSVLIDFLQVVLAHLSQQLRIAPGLICTVNDLRRLTRTLLDVNPAAADGSILSEGWRRTHIRPLLEAVMRGEHAVRVGRPRAAAPLEFVPTPPQGT